MGLFRRKKSEPSMVVKAPESTHFDRIDKMPAEDVFLMVEAAMGNMGEWFSQLRRTYDEDDRLWIHEQIAAYQKEVQTGLEVLRHRDFQAPSTYK